MNHRGMFAGLGALVLLVFLSGALSLRYSTELSFYIQPTAEKALILGQKSLNSLDHDSYSIEKAEYFLRKAYKIDPTYPYVNHELARIEFLKGDFRAALEFIDAEVALQGEHFPNAFYIRGLIEGYMEQYHAAVLDYAVYLKHDPQNWAAINDYSWVLLKSGRTEDALVAIEDGLVHFPGNPWLLNTKAVAHYELKEYEASLLAALSASMTVQGIDESDWLVAYPGNDPRTAGEGMLSLDRIIQENMHRAAAAVPNSALQ